MRDFIQNFCKTTRRIPVGELLRNMPRDAHARVGELFCAVDDAIRNMSIAEQMVYVKNVYETEGIFVIETDEISMPLVQAKMY